MPTIFKVAQAGNAAIYRASNPSAFTNPTGNITDVFFHSSLDYFKIAETLTASITLPQRNDGSSDTWWGGSTSIPNGGSEKHVIGTASTTLPAFVLCEVDGDVVGTMTPLELSSNGFRIVALVQDGQELSLYENYFVNSNQSIGSQSVSVTVYIFDNATPDSNAPLFYASSTRVTAGQEKFDSDNGYLITDNGASPPLSVPTGVIIDVENGGARFVNPDGTTDDWNGYGGSFTAVNWQGART